MTSSEGGNGKFSCGKSESGTSARRVERGRERAKVGVGYRER